MDPALAEKILSILEDHKRLLSSADGRRWVAATTTVAVQGYYKRIEA